MWAILAIAVAIGVSVGLAHGNIELTLYLISLTGIGMLSTAGMVVSEDSFGPVSDNAAGVAEMSGEFTGEAERVMVSLDAVGNTTKAITKGVAIGSAVIASVSLFGSFVETIVSQLGLHVPASKLFSIQQTQINVANPTIFIGLLIGGSVAFLFSSLAIRAVGRSAGTVVQEVRRQFREHPGIMDYTEKPEYGRVISICTAAAQRELVTPALLAVLTPVIVGFGINYLALGAFLAAAILTGQLMANFLSNSGGAWDNAKKYIEDGHEGGKGSEAHTAAVIGDTVGDPFKDTAGPALNPLIKVMNLVSLLILPAVITLRHHTGARLGIAGGRDRDPGRRHRLLQAQVRGLRGRGRGRPRRGAEPARPGGHGGLTGPLVGPGPGADTVMKALVTAIEDRHRVPGAVDTGVVNPPRSSTTMPSSTRSPSTGAASAGKPLVIVESPAKARTIGALLGADFVVESSVGHIRDLPRRADEIPAAYKGEGWARLGVDVDNGFKPLYVVAPEKKSVVARLKSLLAGASEVYLATDEDREGESIAWHLTEVLSPRVPIKRMVFHEITARRAAARRGGVARPRPPPGRRPGGAAHPRPPVRLRGVAGAVEEGDAAAVGGPRPERGHADDRRARTGPHAVPGGARGGTSKGTFDAAGPELHGQPGGGGGHAGGDGARLHRDGRARPGPTPCSWPSPRPRAWSRAWPARPSRCGP